MILKLDYIKALKINSIVDFKDYMKKYSNGSSYNLLKGSPKIINVEGTYVKLFDIPKILKNKAQVIVSEDFIYNFNEKVQLRWSR